MGNRMDKQAHEMQTDPEKFARKSLVFKTPATGGRGGIRRPSTSGDPKIKAGFPSVRKLTLANLFLTRANVGLISSVDSSVGNSLPVRQFFPQTVRV